MRRAIAVLIAAVVLLFLGPLLTSPRGHSAGAPFVYEPPEGFKIASVNLLSAADKGEAQVWTFTEPSMLAAPNPNPPSVVVTHTKKEMSVEEADLAKLTEEMPNAFDGCTWVHRRHELRTRADGARVGIIEGDCDKEIDLSTFGLPTKIVKQRKLQLMFPDDLGTSIVTVSYASEHATRWEPLFEATIGKAKGVATRTPRPPPWLYLAWGAAGLVLGWLATALLNKKSKPA